MTGLHPSLARRLGGPTAAAVGLLLVVAALPRYREALFDNVPWDLVSDHRMARAFLDGYNPYGEEGMARSGLEGMGPVASGHPPTTALWALPFARQGLRAANLTLAAVMTALLSGVLLLLARTLGAPWRLALPLAWLALAYLLFTPVMTYHLGVGQLSIAISALYALAWWSARAGRDGLAGAALGAACTIKLFPGVMVLFFLVLGRLRAVAAAGLVYLAAAALVTARFGWSSWPQFFSRQGAIADLSLDGIQNQSLHGIVLRLFHPACGPHGNPLPAATAISVALSLGAIAYAGHRARRAVREGAFDLAYAAFVTLSVLASQWAWEHYNVIYVLPVAVAVATLASRWPAPQERRRALAGFAVVAALLTSWLVDAASRLDLQKAVRAGDRSRHALLHASEIINWAPPLALLALLFVLLGRRRAGAPPGAQALSAAAAARRPRS